MCEGTARDGSTSQCSKTCTFVMFLYTMYHEIYLHHYTHCASTIVIAVQNSIIHINQAEDSELTGIV